MSDSEEESQDRQLKIVVLGDGTSGKPESPEAQVVVVTGFRRHDSPFLVQPGPRFLG